MKALAGKDIQKANSPLTILQTMLLRHQYPSNYGTGQNTALVYQIDNEQKRLLYMAEGRSGESLEPFFTLLGEKRSKSIRYVCTGMWRAYMGVAAEKVPHALNILDRFHAMKKFNAAVDQVRRSEMNEMKHHHGSDAVLKDSRWCY